MLVRAGASDWRYSRKSSPSSAPSKPRARWRLSRTRSSPVRSMSEAVETWVMAGSDTGFPKHRAAKARRRGVLLPPRNGQGWQRAAGAGSAPPGSHLAMLADLPCGEVRSSWQLVESVAEPLEAHRNADALFGSLENDEGRGLAGAQLLDQIVVHDHFGDAAVGQATHEPGPADVGLVDLQPEPGRQQHAQRRQHGGERETKTRGAPRLCLADDPHQLKPRPA